MQREQRAAQDWLLTAEERAFVTEKVRLAERGKNPLSHDRHSGCRQSNTDAGLSLAQVIDLAVVPRAPDRTTIDHALIRGLAGLDERDLPDVLIGVE